jgi:dihydrofolate synthase / folylpolyglutamate synthase
MTASPLTTYSEACRFLDDLQMHKIKLGLEAMRSVLAGLGSPEQRCPAIHVAGTNGKGSVCTMLQTMLSSAGYRTGLYTSPHLSSVRERFRIDDRFIDRDEFTRLLERVRRSLGTDKITYFECTTALAFSWFADSGCDIVILETGMGGRLDATNVVVPQLSMITTVSLDHEQYLGDTIEQIAFEKAGIIKNRVPVISGVTDFPARKVIERICVERAAPLFVLGRDFRAAPNGEDHWAWQDRGGKTVIDRLPVSKNGVWQLDNSACAIAAALALRDQGFTLTDDTIRAGIGAAFWPGRMEFLEVAATGRESNESDLPGAPLRFLLDGAHNRAGVECLIAGIKEQFTYERLIVVWASMADKNYRPLLQAMASLADLILLTRPQSERAAAPAEMARALEHADPAWVSCHETVAEALSHVTALARPGDLVVVAGSLYLIGEFRRLLVGEVVGDD